MYILTTEMEDLNLELLVDATGMNEEPAALAPVVALYTDTKPAQPSALYSNEAAAVDKAAIQRAIGGLQLLLLDAAQSHLLPQIRAIAEGLVNGSTLMLESKVNSLAVIETLCRGNIAPTSTGRLNDYKRKYETAGEVSQYLGTASSLKEVASLYYVNAELIELTPSLKKDFTDKKARLYRPSAAAAA